MRKKKTIERFSQISRLASTEYLVSVLLGLVFVVLCVLILSFELIQRGRYSTVIPITVIVVLTSTAAAFYIHHWQNRIIKNHARALALIGLFILLLATAKLGRLLKSEDGPFPICEACSNRCFFATIGHHLAAQPNLRRGLSEAFKKKDRMKAVRTYCRGLARQALYTDHPKTVDGLALCFYIHAAEAVGAKSTIERVKLVFGQS